MQGQQAGGDPRYKNTYMLKKTYYCWKSYLTSVSTVNEYLIHRQWVWPGSSSQPHSGTFTMWRLWIIWLLSTLLSCWGLISSEEYCSSMEFICNCLMGVGQKGEGMDKNISVGFFFFLTYISPFFQNVMKSVRKCLRRSVHRPLWLCLIHPFSTSLASLSECLTLLQPHTFNL